MTSSLKSPRFELRSDERRPASASNAAVIKRTFGALIAVAASAWSSGCAAPGAMPLGTSIEQARHGVIPPSGESPLPGGGTRLEFAQGMYGRQTYMLDFDAGGRLQRSTQVLTEANLGKIEPGLTVADVRARYGRPAEVFGAPWQRLHVWNYRFADGECVWFQVSIDAATQRVTHAGLGQDPVCDHGKD